MANECYCGSQQGRKAMAKPVTKINLDLEARSKHEMMLKCNLSGLWMKTSC